MIDVISPLEAQPFAGRLCFGKRERDWWRC